MVQQDAILTSALRAQVCVNLAHDGPANQVTWDGEALIPYRLDRLMHMCGS
jgi:hypothetical protein